MPTILNNACINRVQKVLKLKVTSNDLNQMKVIPFFLFRAKDGLKANFISNIYFAMPSGHGYSGALYISSCGYYPPVSFSFIDGNVFDSISVNPLDGDGINYFLSVGSEFVIGEVRPEFEIHIYYYSELCSVDFDCNYVTNSG